MTIDCTFPGDYSPSATAGDCVFDESRAAAAIEFFPDHLQHIKGELAGLPIVLQQWQRDIIGTLFGWYRADGTRRYRSAYIEVPRKAGKSTMSAGIALLALYMDDEPGAEVYSCAAEREQAAIVFELAKEQVLRNPALTRRSKTYRRSITHIDQTTGMLVGAYHALSAESSSKHGYNPHCIIFDELHAQKTSSLWDVMNTGVGARRQPLVIAITTAGHDRESVCYQQREYAAKVRDGIIDDPSHLPVIYCADREDDWTDPAVWHKAQPNLGISVSEEFYASECRKAQENKAFENTFKRLYLNIWTEQADRAMPMDAWDACAGIWIRGGESKFAEHRAAAIERLTGRECYGGLDLASKTDIAGFALTFPDDDPERGEPESLLWFWSPEEAASKRSREPHNAGKYELWAHEGLIELCPGTRIEQSLIEQQILECNGLFLVHDVAYDPWNAEALRQNLEAAGIEMVQFQQTLKNFNEPLKELLGLVAEHKMRHQGNPVLRWMASNLATYEDGNGNLRPDKKHSGDKIDGIVALVMSLGRMLLCEEETVSGYAYGDLST